MSGGGEKEAISNLHLHSSATFGLVREINQANYSTAHMGLKCVVLVVSSD